MNYVLIKVIPKADGIVDSETDIAISSSKKKLKEYCKKNDINYEIALQETDLLDLMEGIYLKVEEGDYILFDNMDLTKAFFMRVPRKVYDKLYEQVDMSKYKNVTN